MGKKQKKRKRKKVGQDSENNDDGDNDGGDKHMIEAHLVGVGSVEIAHNARTRVGVNMYACKQQLRLVRPGGQSIDD